MTWAIRISKNCIKTEKNKTPFRLKTTMLSMSTSGNVLPRMMPNMIMRPNVALKATSDRRRSFRSRANRIAICAKSDRS